MSQSDYKAKVDLYYIAKDAYYQGEAIISDDEFDSLEDELIEQGFDPTVGYQEVSTERKVKHGHRMLSLSKTKVETNGMSNETAQALFDRIGPGQLSWKYDGVAIEASYKMGKLEMVSTRGDGNMGVNVHAKLASLFPQCIGYKDHVGIRFEMVMNQRVFESKYSDKYSHSRNLVAGIVNDINKDDVRKHDLIPIMLESVTPTGEILDLDMFPEFTCKEITNCTTPDQLVTSFASMAQRRKEYQFGTDGIVFNTIGVKKVLHNGTYPKHAVAIKFKAPTMQSTVTDIKWNMNKTGRWTPVVYFMPIIVDGRKIQRASGHHLQYLVVNDIQIGSNVTVTLANDIIPMIKKA